MKSHGELEDKLYRFRNYLLEEEHPDTAIEEYGRDTRAFFSWLSDDGKISREAIIGYKQATIEGYKTTNADSILVSVSRFLDFIQKGDCQVKLFKMQRSPFHKKDKELTKEGYNKLAPVAKAKSGSYLFLMIQAIYNTGIRINEYRLITREASERGSVTVYNKGRE